MKTIKQSINSAKEQIKNDEHRIHQAKVQGEREITKIEDGKVLLEQVKRKQ